MARKIVVRLKNVSRVALDRTGRGIVGELAFMTTRRRAKAQMRSWTIFEVLTEQKVIRPKASKDQ
ncbi:MAG: hypothetical protein JNM47_10800 [Hyphomonadaceae bacterium]|nr:hypothetical protein [Hyphomonadaceae bacterium]